MENKSQNLLLIKPNAMNAGFSSIVLKEIESQFNIDKLELIKFNKKDSKKFYESAYQGHINKYGKEMADDISNRLANFMSSDKMLFLLISPKMQEHIGLNKEVFIEVSRAFAENLRERYLQDHEEFKQAANTIHCSDSPKAFDDDLKNIQSVLKTLESKKLTPLANKNIEKSIVGAISEVLKLENISTSSINFLKKAQDIAKKIVLKPDLNKEKIMLSSYMQLIDQGININNNYSFKNEKFERNLVFMNGKLGSDLNCDKAGERLKQLAKVYTAITNRDINQKHTKSSNEIER